MLIKKLNLKLKIWQIFLFTLLACCQHNSAVEQANVGELFTYKIEPSLFNWTHQVLSAQFRYRPSIEGYPDLPSWMRFVYSNEYHAGFLYGTPPDSLAGHTIFLDIVALNKQNYETRDTILAINIVQKFPLPNVIQMKIDNLNWVHLMDPGRVENLLNIFRKDLWPESENDLSMVFMESAINMGGRLPLRPQQREGVIVHLGSSNPFSSPLKQLQEEVRPLYKLPSCTYKRTSVQKLFENAGFKLDWCAFRILGADTRPEILYHNHVPKSHDRSDIGNLKRTELELSPESYLSKDDVPERNYIDEFAFAFGIPGIIFAIFLAILSVALCFHHNKLHDPYSEYFLQNIFHICEESCCVKHDSPTPSEQDFPHNSSSTVQMVQCSDTSTNQPVTTLKSLKDPNLLLDNTSLRSVSPNNNFYIVDSPSNTYLRPKPPPYKGGTINRSGGVDI